MEGSPNILIKTVAYLDGFTKQEIFDAISNYQLKYYYNESQTFR